MSYCCSGKFLSVASKLSNERVTLHKSWSRFARKLWDLVFFSFSLEILKSGIKSVWKYGAGAATNLFHMPLGGKCFWRGLVFDLMVRCTFGNSCFTACNHNRSSQVGLMFITLLLDLIWTCLGFWICRVAVKRREVCKEQKQTFMHLSNKSKHKLYRWLGFLILNIYCT